MTQVAPSRKIQNRKLLKVNDTSCTNQKYPKQKIAQSKLYKLQRYPKPKIAQQRKSCLASWLNSVGFIQQVLLKIYYTFAILGGMIPKNV